MKRRYTPWLLFGLFLIILTVTSCAPEGPTDIQFGILYGILHGIVFPFSLIGKLLGMEVGLYAVNNTGLTYWAGYIIGILIIFGGPGSRL